MTHQFMPGEKLWLRDPEEAYLMGTVRTVSPNQIELVSERNQIIRMHPRDALNLDLCGSHVDSKKEQDNLVDLDEFSEGAILYHVRKRFMSKIIYTHVGAILVAVNPFEQLDIYSRAEMDRAQRALNDNILYPHVYVTAATAFSQLKIHKRHQSVLISGESGAGKTETTKKVLEYLASMSPGGKSLDDPNAPGMEKKILQSNPLLEALGNSKTRRNDNSSRFGKWMKVDFDSSCRIQGCEIVNYLLEKSRVVGFNFDERNYHIFYQLLAGATPELKQQLGLQDPKKYRYLRECESFTVPTIDDAADFHEVQAAMATLQIPIERQMEMFKVLAAILAIGNITFSSEVNGEIEAGESRRIVQEVSVLLSLDPTGKSLSTALTEKHMYIKGVLQPPQPYTAEQASDNRDALVKALYSNLFDETIKHINTTLRTSASLAASPSTTFTHIGVLDIFGFEVFKQNSFEQLCINYCNEKLQFHFNDVIFSAEMQMYRDEGISTESISFKDNSECVALIEGKPIGLLCMLDAECAIGTANDVTYVANINKAFGEVDAFKSSKLAGSKICWKFLASYGVADSSRGGGSAGKALAKSCSDPNCTDIHARDITDIFPKSTSSEKDTWKEMCKYATEVFAKNHHNEYFQRNRQSKVCFSVKHFAGYVDYTVGREPKTGEIGGYSRDWLDKNSDELSALVVDCMVHSASSLVRDLFAEKAAAVAAGSGSKVSLGGQFRNQLISLLDNLNRTEPHFVRCVKSNDKKKGGVFDGPMVLEQLKYSGLFEAIRIRRAGYAYRATHDVFANQYLILVPGLLREKFKNPQYFNSTDACHRIIKQVVEREKVLYQSAAVVGSTKVFIKENKHRTELDHLWRSKREKFHRIVERFVKFVIDRHKTRSEREKLDVEMKRIRERQEFERRELERLEQHRMRMVVVVQKYVRRFLVCRLMANMQDLIDLRRALDPNNTSENKLERIHQIIARIEEHIAPAAPLPGPSNKSRRASTGAKVGLRLMFAQEVTVARTMIKLIEIQDTFRRDVKQAVEECDVVVLNKLLVRAERLEMLNDHTVIEAREELRKLHRRRTVMKHMVAFLKNENEYSADPVELLREASSLDIDDMFISKVRRVYEGAGPRLHARMRLRSAIETVDRRNIEQGLIEIEAMQKFKGREGFAESEKRSAQLMLRLLSFDRQLCPERDILSKVRNSQLLASFLDDDQSGDKFSEDGHDIDDEGPKLTADMLSLCDEICSTGSLEAARTAKRRLQQLAGKGGGPPGSGLEEIIRCYKWSKMLCSWKYPETRLTQSILVGAGNGDMSELRDETYSLPSSAREEEYEFFGLRPSEGRSTLFLIRMLHNDIDPRTGGEAPPSVQAALGALELPVNVKETMEKLERAHIKEEEEKKREAALVDDTAAKKKSSLFGTEIAKGSGKMTEVTRRRIHAASLLPKKEKLSLKNIKSKPVHDYIMLSEDLAKKLLDSRINVSKQLERRDDSIVALDRYKKKSNFR